MGKRIDVMGEMFTAVPFGETRPDATQFFNSYSIADGTCVWDVY